MSDTYIRRGMARDHFLRLRVALIAAVAGSGAALTACAAAQTFPTEPTQKPVLPTASQVVYAATEQHPTPNRVSLSPEAVPIALPTGEYVVYSRAENTRDPFGNPTTSLYAMPLDGSDAILWIASADPGAMISPDGTEVAFTRRSALWGPAGEGPSRLTVIDLTTGATTTSASGPWGEEVAWSSDGSSLIVSREVDLAPQFPGVFASLLIRIDTHTWIETAFLDCPSLPDGYTTASCQNPATEPGDGFVAFALGLGAPGDQRQGVYLIRSDCAAPAVQCFENREGPLHIWLQYAWHPGGRFLATLPFFGSLSERGIRIFDTEAMEWSSSVPATDNIESIDGLAWSSDGSKLALNIGPAALVIDIATGQKLAQHEDPDMIGVEFWLHVP